MGIETLAIASLVTGVLGAGVSAIGGIQQSQAAAQAAQYQAGVAQINQQIATQNAQYANQAGAAEASKQQLKTAALVGSIEAQQAASGLDVNTGSPARIRQSQDIIGELDAMTIRNNAARSAYGYQAQAAGYEAQAALDKTQASQISQAGFINAASSILGGVSSVGGNYLKFQQAGIFGTGGGSSGGLY